MLAAGLGPDRNSDQFTFVHRALAGDGEIVARVSQQTNTNGGAKAGVMIRSSLAAGSPHVSIFLTPTTGIIFQARTRVDGWVTVDGAANQSAAVWLKVRRVANRFSAYRSIDGVNWSQVGGTVTLDLPNAVWAGLAQSSVRAETLGSARYDGAIVRSLTPGNVPGATIQAIGTGTSLNVAGLLEGGAGVSLQTNSTSIGGALDDFLFVSRPLDAGAELVTRLAGVESTRGWASAGLMVRLGTGRDAIHYSVVQTAMNGIVVYHRAAVAANTSARFRRSTPPGAVWLKITRRSNFYAAFLSTDGSVWEALGEPVILLEPGPAAAGLVVTNDQSASYAGAHFDQIQWPATPVTPPEETDPVLRAGLEAWRKADANGISCMDCHTPFGYDVAQFNFTQADVQRAASPHVSPTEADAIYAMLERYRDRYPPAGGLKDFRTFRPLQPAGVVAGGENASPDARDYAFGRYLESRFRIAQGRITTLAEARTAAQELIEVDVASIPIGLKFNRWSESALRDGPIEGGKIAEWLPSAGLVPKPQFAAAWKELQNDYIRDPSTDNMWAIYEATAKWVDLDPHNFQVGVVNDGWRALILGQYRSNLIFTHDELLKARGLPSLLDNENGVRPHREVRKILSADLASFWTVGDAARIVQGKGFEAMPRRNRETVHNDRSYNSNLAEVNGWQIQAFRSTWFWIGWMMDNSLRFSGEGSTLSGEYFIGTLWFGETDNLRTGDSASSHGFRFHEVFFNAVHQLKLGYQPGAWRDNTSQPQHFEASKGYYLAYGRWRPRSEPTEPGLEQSGALYRRFLSNHLRMAILIHADEARKRNGVYFNENFTLSDIPLWKEVLAWADPEWQAQDELLLAELRASIGE